MKLVPFAALLCCSLAAQVAQQANEGYRTPEGRARVAGTLAAPDREEKQKPRELVASMGLKPGMTVVDLGTGVGYMLPYLSAAVGPEGKVIAEDIFPDFLDKAKATGAPLKNVTYVLGTDRSPNLSENVADAILMYDVYHHFDYPAEMLAAIGRALKPDGRLVLVEYHKNDKAMGGRAKQHIRLTADDFIKEIEANGFKLMSRRDHVPEVQWVGIFTRN